MRECLGWVLLQQGRLRDAESAYLDDLQELPNNPWALTGLQQVYSRQEGARAKARLQQVRVVLLYVVCACLPTCLPLSACEC
jgi:cytochrome c-type biogenesis protein CcmH/NrfG